MRFQFLIITFLLSIFLGEVLQSPGPRFPSPVPSGYSQASLSIKELKEFDVIIENTIESPEESSNFFVPCHLPYIYLYHITNSFAKKVGKGAFSEVFEGVTRSKEIPLAIKRLHCGDDETKKLVNFEGSENNLFFVLCICFYEDFTLPKANHKYC